MTTIEARTLGEQIYQALEAAIVDDGLPPGTELPEVDLAEQYGTSRGPVREALRQLASDGLVVLRPRRGAVVRMLSRKEFLDAYQVREVLEVLAVCLAVPILTPVELDELDDLMERMGTAVFRDDIKMFFEANGDFHRFFVDHSGNERLQQLHLQLSRPMARYRRRSLALRGDLQSSFQEHEKIMVAVHAGDAELAADLTRTHISVPQHRLETLDDEEWDRMQTAPAPTGRSAGGGR
ncbi:Transcriptional regulator, GntR family [hydrothermal vent metagenome]|uniref:Transcriptional regulator, GntR family n=1 Tax=hydrothermal vent metagenome TaxID=652676 RepID=A0A3B0T7J1_9ZZZZ